MNLLCKLLGHKWRDTSFIEYDVIIDGKPTAIKIDERTCDNCGIIDRFSETPSDSDQRMHEDYCKIMDAARAAGTSIKRGIKDMFPEL